MNKLLLNRFLFLAVTCPLGLAACSDDGPQFNGPKADMTEAYPGHSLALGKSRHKKSTDRVPFLSMPAIVPDEEGHGSAMGTGATGAAAQRDVTPHPVQTDTEVSYGPNK